jgi:hypothetical protein
LGFSPTALNQQLDRRCNVLVQAYFYQKVLLVVELSALDESTLILEGFGASIKAIYVSSRGMEGNG